MIRAALIYVALLWVALQAADLMAGANLLSEQQVRWIIVLGVAGLPVTILASWFLEAPWKQRKWIGVAGDLLIIVAVAAAAALFAWQQWFTSFTRPTLAVLAIEATDTRTDSEDLAAHLAFRLRTAFATRAEIRVVELASSQHSDLDGRAMKDKASLLSADYVVTGTLAQNSSQVRLNLQLFSENGELLFGETYEDRLLDMTQLQNRVLTELWQQLPLPQEDIVAVRDAIADCAYPDDRAALLAIAGVDNGEDVELDHWLTTHDDAGMLYLANARRLFADVSVAEPARKPVLQKVAMQNLASAEQRCPGLPDIGLLRVLNTNQPVDGGTLRQYPNSATLLERASRTSGDPDRTNALLGEAQLLDPLGGW